MTLLIIRVSGVALLEKTLIPQNLSTGIITGDQFIFSLVSERKIRFLVIFVTYHQNCPSSFAGRFSLI
jgi:methylglyoxal synthase